MELIVAKIAMPATATRADQLTSSRTRASCPWPKDTGKMPVLHQSPLPDLNKIGPTTATGTARDPDESRLVRVFHPRENRLAACHCFAEAVLGVTRCLGTACAKQWHTVFLRATPSPPSSNLTPIAKIIHRDGGDGIPGDRQRIHLALQGPRRYTVHKFMYRAFRPHKKRN